MDSEATAETLPIFVYGTLMPGQPNDFMWQDTIRAVEAAQVGDCCLYVYGCYPVMVNEVGYTVQGALVWVANERFAHIIQDLDYLEGFVPGQLQDSNFRRVKVQASTRAGRTVTAWTYMGIEGRVQGHPIVESGDWADYIATKDS